MLDSFKAIDNFSSLMFMLFTPLSKEWFWQGYWMVKRAVGTKACLLGKAVTCKYLRQDNFLEVIKFDFSMQKVIFSLC